MAKEITLYQAGLQDASLSSQMSAWTYRTHLRATACNYETQKLYAGGCVHNQEILRESCSGVHP